MKRALYLLALPATAVVVAVLSRSGSAPPAPATAPPAVAPSPASTRGSTWVTTIPARTPRAATAERPASAPHAGPKPPTDSRTALLESHVPALPVASLDQTDSPRQRLLSGNRGPSESRLAQVERLSNRSEAALSRLKAARAGASGEERVRIARAIQAIERNQSFRTRIVAGRTPPPPLRAGTGEGPVPQYVKPAR